MPRSVPAWQLLLAVCMQCLTSGCHEEPTRFSDVPVFIISIDTLRADRLPVYGYEAGSTPSIDRFRADSILFERAYSHVPLTLPSHVSILTGYLPPEHGIRDNIGYVLRSNLSTLPQLLRDQGYVTGAAVSSWVLRREAGLDSGFDFYDDELDPARHAARKSEERDGERTRQSLGAWLGRQSTARVFGLLHLFEPHAPYEAPPPFDSATDSYDGEVAYADSIVGRFLDDLRTRGLYDRSLIVLVSDHGEGLGDHGEDEHGVFLYRESIHVPLLVKLPKNDRRGATVTHPVALIDIVPTVLAVTGVASPSDLLGLSLTGPQPSDRAVYAETYFPRLHLGWSELFAMIDSDHHYIHAPRAELYAWSDDAQKQNLLETERRAAVALRQRLQRIDQRFDAPGAVDPEERRHLAALGYLGSSRISEGQLPDPKDHIGSIRTLKRALSSFNDGDWAEAVIRSESILAENPRMVDGWILQAAAQRRLGENARALSTIRAGLRLFPTHPDLLLMAADVLLELGQVDEAQSHAELAMKGDAGAAREMCARVSMQKGNLDSAENYLAEEASRPNPRVSTLLLIAEIMKRQGRFEEELANIDRALETLRRQRMDTVARLQYERGLALLELRRSGEAERAFREEIRYYPWTLEAWGMLAVSLGIEGRLGEARDVLNEMARVNPGPDAARLRTETLRIIDASRTSAGRVQ